MIKFSAYITILLIPILSSSAEFTPEEYWEEFSGEELPLLLEYQSYGGLMGASVLTGYRFHFPETDSSAELLNESNPYRLCDFKFTCRASGEELSRTLLRSGGKFGDRIAIEILSEKDPGEEFNDFYTGNISYYAPSITAVAGSYSAGYSQGLVLWRGFDWGAYPENPVKPLKSDFLRGYSSTAENNMLFGGGIRYRYSGAEVILLYSDTKIDASGDDEGVLFLQETGIHVSESEKANEDRLTERLLSARFKLYPLSGFELGISGITSRYSPPFAEKDSILYTYALESSKNSILGIDANYEYNNITAGAEYASMTGGGGAFYSSMMINSGKSAVQIAGRYISEKYQNLRSVYPEGNEYGVSVGVSVKPWYKGIFNVFFDSWTRPWRTYNWETPPEGHEASVQYSQELYDWQLGLRLRQTENNPDFGGTTRNQIRINLQRYYSDFFGRARFELMDSKSPGEDNTGYMISAGWGVQFDQNTFEMSISGFDVPHYECRIYQYERDVPGLIAVPFYYGKGMAANIYFKRLLMNNVSIATKAGLTFYSARPNDLSEATDKRLSIYINYHYTR